MALFEFDLMPVEEIAPWGRPDNPNLSWFALTWGRFRMPVGDQVLFRYRKEAFSNALESLEADYQIASIARDILGSVTAGITPLPPFFEHLASNRELMDRLLSTPIEEDPDAELDPEYTAWRWLGERSPWTGYFVECPDFYFIRLGDRIHIRWDNRNKRVDGCAIWEASYGSHEMSVEAFTAECRDFSNRLLAEMADRISRIESGNSRPQVAVSIDSLREQHEWWRKELDFDLEPAPPDIPWDEAEREIRRAAAICAIPLPASK